MSDLKFGQPPPSGGSGDVWAEVIETLGCSHPLRDACEARRAFGIKKYQTPLGFGDGRDNEQDVLEERLDLAAYLWKAGYKKACIGLLSEGWLALLGENHGVR